MNFIQRAIARVGLFWFDKKLEDASMKGWKTWAGGLVLILPGMAEILIGAASLISEVVNGTFNIDAGIAHIKAGSISVGAGLAAVGIGHKIEKHTEAMRGSQG